MQTINYLNIEQVTSEIYRLLRGAVSKERGEKADRYRFIEDSKRSIIAELLLQYSLDQTFGCKVELDLDYNEYGKPFMKQFPDFYYNLSHSGKWVVIAYGDTEVGIDIEQLRTGHQDIADRFFAEEERQYIKEGNKEEAVSRFTKVWTLKESYIKYLGTGLSTGLSTFSINVEDGIVTDKNRELEKELRLQSYAIDSEHFLSICTTSNEVALKEIKLEEIIEFINKK